VVIQRDGRIVVGGKHDGLGELKLARYNTDGTLDAMFGNAGKIISFALEAEAICIQADDKIVAAGRNYYSSNYRLKLARYNTDGTLDSTFGIEGVATSVIISKYTN
jgi:uncharacterized delta-60 repeat protein